MRFYIFLFSLLLMSCADTYNGFDLIKEGLHFKLVSLGEDSISLHNSDYLLIDFNFCENSKCEDVELSNRIAVKGNELWKNLKLNDKAIFLFDNEESGLRTLMSMEDTTQLSFPAIAIFKVVASYSDSRYVGRYTDYEEIMNYRENDLINTWVEDEEGFVLDSSGIYIDIIKQGNGDTALIDREVSISYKAYFADGRMFDNTDDWSDTFRYVVGSPNQVIIGLNAGIQGMREGCEAKIIIPSQLAFGQAGSSTGLVPPFEPLKYELTLIEVNNN